MGLGGWVGLRAVLEGCGKGCHHRDPIPGPPSRYTDHAVPDHSKAAITKKCSMINILK